MENYINIVNFKCFVDTKIPLRKLTIFAGGNSSGKSSVIQSILLLRSAIEKNRTGEDKVMLNGDYLLNLGNSFDVISQNATSDNIKIIIQYDRNKSKKVVFSADSKEAQVFLKIDTNESNLKKDVTESDPPLLKTGFHYLNAERLGPRPYYPVTDRGNNVGWQGEFAISLLSSSIADTPKYNVPPSKMYLESKNPSLRAQVEIWMNEIIPGLTIDSQKISEINQAYIKYGKASPYNVGFGISYVLPIIVSGLIAREGEMMIVENPEAHLHPSGQSRIGKFLAQVAAYGTQVIIETHSEHVIDGIVIACLKKIINNAEVNVNFFNKNEQGQININSIDINDAGDLTNYPVGFFDQQQKDFSEIVIYKRNNNKL